jgi:hypothetical protein
MPSHELALNIKCDPIETFAYVTAAWARTLVNVFAVETALLSGV